MTAIWCGAAVGCRMSRIELSVTLTVQLGWVIIVTPCVNTDGMMTSSNGDISASLALGKIHRSPVDSPHKGQCGGALTFSLICARANGWTNTRDSGDLRRHPAHYNLAVIRTRHPVRKSEHCEDGLYNHRRVCPVIYLIRKRSCISCR